MRNRMVRVKKQLLCDIAGVSKVIEITVNRTRKQTNQAQEVLCAIFLGEGLGTRIYAHKLLEIYHQVTYSITCSGKTIWLGSSMAALYVNGDYQNDPLSNGIDDTAWSELHKYNHSGGSTSPVQMQFITGLGLGNPETLYRESDSSLWVSAGGLIRGIATTTTLVYCYEGGIIPAITIQNANVDCNIP